MDDYINKTESWTGADIEAVCRNAGVNSIKESYKLKDLKKLIILKKHFDKALETVAKSIGKNIEEPKKEIKKKIQEKK